MSYDWKEGALMRKYLRKFYILLIIIFLVIIAYLILERIPVKRSISEEEVNNRICENKTYICRHAATTGPPWEIYKQPDDMPQLACLEGNVPFDALNHGEFFSLQIISF